MAVLIIIIGTPIIVTRIHEGALYIVTKLHISMVLIEFVSQGVGY